MADIFAETLEPYWIWAFATFNNVLLIMIVTFVVHVAAYFIAYTPFFIADFIPSLQKYKIQNRPNNFQEQFKCLKGVLAVFCFVELPLMGTALPGFKMLGMSLDAPLPSLFTVCWQVSIFFIMEDFYVYWLHRYMHENKWFYKNIHKVHHEFKAPFGIAGEYAHPIETLLLGFGTLYGPAIFGSHLLTVWIWTIIRTFEVVDVHSGYDFPWSLNNWLPYYAGAQFHDFHHRTFVGNYSTTFTYCDKIFGTDTSYWRYKLKGESVIAEMNPEEKQIEAQLLKEKLR